MAYDSSTSEAEASAGGHGRWAMKPGVTGRHSIIVARPPGSAPEPFNTITKCKRKCRFRP